MDYDEQEKTRPSKKVLNRRLKYFEEHLVDSDYLSESEMQKRDPSGWHYYVGQYNDNRPPPDQCCEAGAGLGGFFLRAMQKQEIRFRESVQIHTDQAVEKIMTGQNELDREHAMDLEDDDDDPAEMMDMWKSIHKSKFLSGEDEFFDYAKVDGNDELDDLKQRQMDEEEKWFDGDE